MEEIVFIGSPSVKLYRILARYEKDCYYIGFAQWKKYFLKENYFFINLRLHEKFMNHVQTFKIAGRYEI